MKFKSEFIVRQIAGEWFAFPLGRKEIQFDGMLSLNETGLFLWHLLEEGYDKDTMVKSMAQEYNISEELAQTDVEEYLSKLTQYGCI